MRAAALIALTLVLGCAHGPAEPCPAGAVRCSGDGRAIQFCTSGAWWDDLPCPEEWVCSNPTAGGPSCYP
jgi:hypothetical protein